MKEKLKKLKIEFSENEQEFTRAIIIDNKIYYIRVKVVELPKIEFV